MEKAFCQRPLPKNAPTQRILAKCKAAVDRHSRALGLLVATFMIRQLISELMAGPQSASPSLPASNDAPLKPPPWDDIAKHFESLVSAVGDERAGPEASDGSVAPRSRKPCGVGPATTFGSLACRSAPGRSSCAEKPRENGASMLPTSPPEDI
jgi:hypothetical protein